MWQSKQPERGVCVSLSDQTTLKKKEWVGVVDEGKSRATATDHAAPRCGRSPIAFVAKVHTRRYYDMRTAK